MITAVSCNDKSAGPETYSWSQQESGTTSILHGVWGTSAQNVFAVGEGGTILHYNGSSWSRMESGTNQTLRGIWGSSGSNIFAVGPSETILHYNGVEWRDMPSGVRAVLYDVYGTAPYEAYAVGNGGTILRYNGQDWNRKESGTIQNFKGVWCCRESIHPALSHSILTVVAVGYGPARYYDGVEWSNLDRYGVHLGVWGTKWSEVFLAIVSGAVARFNGSELENTWGRLADGYLSDIWGSSGDDVFAVGFGGTVLHYDGNAWFTMTTETHSHLTSVWGTGEGNVFAVGHDGIILHYGP